jgi:hypothetical protein
MTPTSLVASEIVLESQNLGRQKNNFFWKGARNLKTKIRYEMIILMCINRKAYTYLLVQARRFRAFNYKEEI